MPTPIFNARLELVSATEISVGTYDIVANIADGTGIYSALDAAVGDVVFLDTFASISAPGTVSRYQVSIINSATPFVLNAQIVYDDTGSSIDLNEVIGAYGFIARSNVQELTYHTAPTLQSIPDYVIQYARSWDNYVKMSTLLSSADSAAIQGTFTNASGSSIAIGTPVYSNASGNIEMVDVSLENSAKNFVGITTSSIPDSSTGSVIMSGLVKNVSTSINVGNIVYISKSGAITSTAPDIGVAGFVSGDFVIKIGQITKNATNPSNKDLLVAWQLMGQL